MLVATGVAANSYRINRAPGAELMNPIILRLLCPPSSFLILTEHANNSRQAVIIALTMISNGVIYGCLALSVRSLLFEKNS